MPDVTAAVNKTKSILEQARPYESYVPEVVRNLDEIVDLLKSPTNASISASLQRLESVRSIVAGYVSYEPTRVNQFLKTIDEIKASLT